MTASEQEQRFFDAVSSGTLVRPSIRAVIMSGDGSSIFVQRPSDSAPGHGYAFIGGEYEYGDTMEGRLRQEVEEETTGRISTCDYVMTVENRFDVGGRLIHGLEHYWLVTLEDESVSSRESALVQEWLPVDGLAHADLRPHVVRDLVASGAFGTARHALVDDWPAHSA